MKIILASASPRRKKLMEVLGVDFEIKVSDCEEFIDKTQSVENIVMSLSLQKARDIANKITKGHIIIGADTVVAYKKEILGKPSNIEDAKRMLTMLSGKTHRVYTGFTLINTTDNSVITDFEKSNVTFRELTEKEIEEYISSDDPMDKAGAYSIQGIASSFVKKLDGDYNNVVGLPIFKLSKYLYRMI